MERAPGWADRPAYLAWLPAFLFGTADPAWRFVLKALPLSLIPSLGLGLAFGLIFPGLPGPDFPAETGTALLLFLLVVVSPVVETMILLLMVLVLRRLAGSGPAVVASALLWAGAHSWQAAAWGLVVWWPFLLMSIALLTWRERGLWTAFAVAVSIHALQNAAGAALLLAGIG